MSVAENLKKIIDDKHIAQRKLSELSGCSVTSISNWINGKTQPRDAQIEKLADALGVKFDDIKTSYACAPVVDGEAVVVAGISPEDAAICRLLDDNGVLHLIDAKQYPIIDTSAEPVNGCEVAIAIDGKITIATYNKVGSTTVFVRAGEPDIVYSDDNDFEVFGVVKNGYASDDASGADYVDRLTLAENTPIHNLFHHNN